MRRKIKKGRLARVKTKLGLPDLEQAKAAVLVTLLRNEGTSYVLPRAWNGLVKVRSRQAHIFRGLSESEEPVVHFAEPNE
jgi:hypothetical protein